MKIEVHKQDGIVILSASGKMVIGGGGDSLHATFIQLVEEGERNFIFDLVKVPYLDSASIGTVVACHKRLRDKDGLVKLALNQKVHDLFTLYELNKVFRIHPSVEAALADFVGTAHAATH